MALIDTNSSYDNMKQRLAIMIETQEKSDMFCPKCKIEYREGFDKCADCGAELIDQLPREAPDHFGDDEFVEVFSTYHQDDISFLKSIFDGEGISYFFQGENSIMLIAAGAYARLMVKAEDAERAREILQDLGFVSSSEITS